MRASAVARDRARHFRVKSETGELRESDHGQLVPDWVALFAPVAFGPRRPAYWPPEGSLLLDQLPLRALTGASFWRPFVHAAKIAENESLERWVAVNGPIIEKVVRPSRALF